MPRKKRNSTTITTEKTNTKAEPKPSASRSKSKSVKPKKSPARPRKTSKSTTRSKSTTKRGRPSKSKAPAQLQDLSRESSVASQSPEPEKKKPGRKASSNIVEKSVGKSKKEPKEEKASAKVTKTPGRPKSKGRSVSKAKAGKSTSRAPKAAKEKEVKEKEKEMKEEVQTRSARKSRKNEKKEERTPSPEPEPLKAAMTTPKRSRKNAKESKMQVTPATEKTRTRVKASLVCKKEDTISERSEREDDHKGRSKKKEKKAAIPSRTQAKLLKKKMKKEQVDLPRFPTQEASIEGLIVEAIKGLKTKAMEDRIIGYLGKRFSDVDGGYIKNVLQKMSFDEKLLLKGLGGGSVSCGKRDFDRAGGSDSMETSMIKKVKTSRNSSPAYKDLQPRGSRKMQTEDDRSDRYERKQNLSNMEIEMVENTEVKNEDGSDASKKMEEEKAVEVTIKEEEIVPPIIIQEEEDIVLKLSASDSKKALIEYYERKLLGIRGLLTTDKKKNEVTPDPGMITQQGVTPNPVETPMPPGDVQTKEQQQEAKKEEQEEVRTTSVRRPELNESVDQIVSEKRNLSFDKEPLLDKKQLGSGKGKENDEKIEEDEGRGMVIWELQESSVLEKTMACTESLKETGQENGIELLMKLLTLPGVVTPDGADDQKMEETPQPRADEEKKVLETTSGEKIEETAENKAAEVASTKTEPKVEETVEKAEEGAVAAKGGNATTAEEDSIRKKMRSAVESYLEMLQGRIDLDYSRENGENTLVSTSEEGGVLQEKDMNKGQAGNSSNNKDADKKIEEDFVKEESDLERPQKLSVSKFLS